MKHTKLTVIIPAYNEASEERNFKQTLEEYYKFLYKKLGEDFDMGIIPNNCTDDTHKLVREFVKGHNQAWCHTMKGYSGKGGAVMRGFDIAQGEMIGFVDADNSTTVKEFWRCFKNMDYYHAGVIASRRMKGSQVIPLRKLSQIISSWLFNIVTNSLFQLGIYDTQCGCKIFKKNCAKFLKNNYTEKGWNFDVDILYLCKINEYKIKEFPIKWTDTAGGKVSMLDGVKAVLKLFKYRMVKFFK